MASFQFYTQLILTGVVSTIIVRILLARYQSKARLAPGPPSLPLIGHLHLLRPLPHRAFHNLSTRYGPIIQLFLGSVPCVVASSPETAKEFLKAHESFFSNRILNAAVHHLSYGRKGFLFAPYGTYWKFMKKLCMSQLLGGRTLDILLPVRREETIRFLGVMLRKGQAGEAVDVGHELMTLANGIISRMIMSRCSSGNDEEAKEIRKLVTDTLELAGEFHLSDYAWLLKRLSLQGRRKKRLQETRDRFDALLEEVIKEHEDKRRKSRELHEVGQIRDLLDILMDIHEDEASEVKFSMENIKAFVLVSEFSFPNCHRNCKNIDREGYTVDFLPSGGCTVTGSAGPGPEKFLQEHQNLYSVQVRCAMLTSVSWCVASCLLIILVQ